MSLADISLADIIRARPSGPKFTSSVRVNTERRAPRTDGVFTQHFPEVVRSVDIDLWVPNESVYPFAPGRVEGVGGRLDGMPGYTVLQDEDDVYLVLVVPLSYYPTMMR